MLITLLLAFQVRTVVIVATEHSYAPKTDALGYDIIASSLVNGHGYGNALVPPAVGHSAFRPPGYPFSLALVYAIVGPHDWTSGRVTNAALGTVVVALIGLLAAMLFDRRVAAVALVIAAVHPTLMLFGSGLQLEPLLMTFELGALAAVLQHRRSQRRWSWLVVAGVLLGLAILTREVAVLLVPPMALLLWPKPRRWNREAAVSVATVFAVAIVVVAPWTIRNAVSLHAFVPVTTDSGVAWSGTYNDTSRNNPQFPGLWLPPWQDPHLLHEMLSLHDRSEENVDRFLRQQAFDYIRAHPGYVPVAFARNTVRLFDLNGPNYALFVSQYLPYPPTLTRAAVYASYPIYVLAIAALFFPAWRRSPRAFWLCPVLAWLGFALIATHIRYRASIEPFLVIAAAVTLVGLYDRAGHRDPSRRSDERVLEAAGRS